MSAYHCGVGAGGGSGAGLGVGGWHTGFGMDPVGFAASVGSGLHSCFPLTPI